jgi:subtilisin family serine protease
MKTKSALFVILTMLLAMLPVGTAAQAETVRYVVVFNGTSIPKGAAKDISKAGGELVESLPEIGVGIAVSDNPDFMRVVKRAPNIHSAGLERYQALPAPDLYELVENGPTGADWGYHIYQWDIRRVRADQAWEETTGSHDTVVAVIDTGIAWNHPDLGPNVVYAACYSVLLDPCTNYPSLHWHGTHVAGTVAAIFDGGAAVGVGPHLGLASYNVFEIIPDFGLGAFDSAIWMAMIDAARENFDVINMSLGGYVVKPAAQQDVAAWTAWNRVVDYVRNQGMIVVASAGNGNFNLNGPVDHIPSDLPGVISVGATGIRPNPIYPQEGAYDLRAFYSNLGAAVVISAPGGECGLEDSCAVDQRPPNWYEYLVFSTYVFLDETCPATESCTPGYAWSGGTSMASPHVAGAAGLVRDLNPKLNANQVRSILKRTAESLGDRQAFGHGMLDVYAAVNE